MADIPIHAPVACTDGTYGKSSGVILNPISRKVTHFVVEDKNLPENPTRLVPFSQVNSTAGGTIRLGCSKEELEKMPPFIVTQFMQESAPGTPSQSSSAYLFPYVVNDTAYDKVQVRNIPPEEIALYSGMHIEATDAKIGKLDELVLDPQSGEITHLLMREGHLWGKKEISIPASAVDFCDSKVIYLNLDKAAVKDFPVVQVKRS